ncbi:hypothetical protein ACE193_21095 [Bernardetia sp. OM2101]|uniref:hypothetical protein n=1 Tax=Bernardetia sp. OM2101 TaxID=3344876 RepID=UPI0035D0012B
MLFYDKKWCKIYYYEELSCVHLDWCGFAKSDQFKEACDFSLELLRDKKVNKMIADNTKSKVVSVEDQKWLMEDWFPRAYEAGYRTSAVVVSTDVFNKVAVKNIVNKMDKGKFVVQYFEKLDNAKIWIKKLKN